ncbi:CAP-associated domain-containing protein [Paenibacillus sp. BSR1-1]|uniref:CAP domain-containing protein n=1 Tax=Paenibacillus sp. BSR1-1 TaxID=3020845 RepID=UPI0025B2795D|nr:CAP-associated domain-containing protein [Paenibacillus sp. BSR1-1]MDN3016391.1 CAP-associated domain-containing protein [Paenibacillus sp. BSR1-1]
MKQHAQSEMTSFKDNPEVLSVINSLGENVQQILNEIGIQFDKQPQIQPENETRKVELAPPTNQIFSIHNVEIGDKKENIERNLGAPKRSSLNEYGANWNTYHENYHNFFMIMYDKNNKAAGLYTNQDLIASTNGIKIGISKQIVREKLGDPLSRIQKGLIIYELKQDSDYDVYLLSNEFVTIFYDKHENNTVTAMQLISKDFEQNKIDFYTKASTELEEGFEYQLFDLTNAARVEHLQSVLTWDQHVRETARKHSTDMAVNKYFDHTNLKGQSPFDRMKEDHIIFQLAGENLAYGQFSSIFAHEGLMNSLGHRENILQKDYEYLGVGVAFNNQAQPYYTENFYAK